MNKLTYTSLVAGLTASAAFAGVSGTANGSGYYEITDPINTDTVLDAAKQYLLTEIVYVSDATITIPAGTIIRGKQGDNSDSENLIEPGTLVITRTGQIDAVGTPAAPIVFTWENDNADPIANPTVPVIGDTLITGLWGGVIILGNAPTNNDQSSSNSLLLPGTDAIEGIVEPVAGANPDLRGIYGGDDCHDSSGTMRYVSIRNGGFKLGAANEINGLTMGGVGSGTVLEYIEVIAGQDDGFEWFGGTVNSKYLLSAYNNDDAFDYDQGFCGLGQFWAVVQADNGVDGDKGGEFDGDDQSGAKPYAVPVIYNMTVIGTGSEVKSGNGGGQIDYDANAGGSLFNSIIVESGIPSLDINGTVGVDAASSSSSVAQFHSGLLNIRGNIWHRDVSNTSPDVVADHDAGAADLALSSDNAFTNPFIGGANFAVMATAKRYSVGGVYLKPSTTPDVTGNLEPYIGTFFDVVSYKGAFDPTATTWTAGWTVPSTLGYFAE
ncbi:MAG: hypothetical protein ACSHYA_05605 [Opitutaceae bacterium]